MYINRRPIDFIPIIKAVLSEFYKKYNNNTHYAVILNLKLDHNKIDVNLTPNKREIFIRREILDKIVKDLKEQIVEKVIEDIPTLNSFQDKKASQNQTPSTQPSILEQFSKAPNSDFFPRKTISFPIHRREEDPK